MPCHFNGLDTPRGYYATVGYSSLTNSPKSSAFFSKKVLQKTEIEDIQELSLGDEEILQELFADEDVSDELDSAQEEIADLEEHMAEQLAKNDKSINNTKNGGAEYTDSGSAMDSIFNILIIGCDTLKKGGVGRSDAMILLSVNEDTEKVHMTSIEQNRCAMAT